MDQLAASSSPASERRRGQRKIAGGWDALFCFVGGSRRARGKQALAAEATPRWRKQQRTAPVDGDPADRDAMRRGAGGDKVSRKGLRLQPGCCFLAPARAPERKLSTSTMDSGNGAHDKQRRLEHKKPRPPRSPPEEPDPSSQMQATDAEQPQPRGGAPAEKQANAAARPRDNEASSKSEAPARGRPCHPKASASAGGEGAFGPVVGLSVVAAVSMAGLLGGRLWAVACVCAWLAALSRLTRRAGGSGTAGSDGGGEETVADDVDSTDYKKLVVLRGLLERDRTKAVKA
ncbi:hypothetical protein HU200_022303 [Digitaria exilis]|uniref:Uncharacterized protein n=1 Tax=Digitaria exilis TaxID=1010633 RepID=A0A835EYT5_9POAL|nr:hypothetical protein HU200_022303 [Digitaria exilis]CAB3494366.1 unnamed protein product [Digitaria exilis]